MVIPKELLTFFIKYLMIKLEKIMDPKALTNLDPKLRETYERVMGTTSPAAAMPSPTPEPTPTVADGGTPAHAATDTAPTASDTLSPVTPELSTPPIQPPVNPWQTPQPAGTTSAPNPFTPTGSLPSPAAVAGQAKESSPLLRILYIIGAVVFFAVYTIFWIKVFKLPFLF